MNAYIPSKITPEKCSSDGIGTQMVGVGETKQGMSVFESKVSFGVTYIRKIQFCFIAFVLQP